MAEEAKAEESAEAPENITSLGDMFNEAEPEPAEPEQETAEKGEAEGQPEANQEPEKEPEAEPPTAEPDSQTEAQVKIAALEKQVNAFKQTAIAERKKRQEVEKQIPDPIEEPEAYSEHIQSEAAASELNLRINLSRDVYSEIKDDFADKESVFLGMVVDEEGNVTDPHLLGKFQSSPNPAKFAYDTATEKMRLAEVNSPNYEAGLRQKMREEILAELKADAEKTEAAKVPDLTTATATGGISEGDDKMPTLSGLFAS